MTQPNTPDRAALIERLDCEMAAARAAGRPGSDYFLDKCGAVAGDFARDEDEGIEERKPGSPWSTHLGGWRPKYWR